MPTNIGQATFRHPNIFWCESRTKENDWGLGEVRPVWFHGLYTWAVEQQHL